MPPLLLLLLWAALLCPALAEPTTERFTLAAGCFWSVEMAFQRAPGVISTRVGYAGGTVAEPSYEDVTTGRTGHTESVEVTFDPAAVSLGELLRAEGGQHAPADAPAQRRGQQRRAQLLLRASQ